MDAIARWSARTPEIRMDTPPIDEEVYEAITTLHNLVEQDAALEDKISEIQARIDRYNSLRRMYHEEVYRRRAVIAPVRFLPAEMLSYIFSFFVDSSPYDVLRASHVCKDWNFATKASRLWSHIVLDVETPGAEQLTRLFLRRSREAPLRVTFHQSEHVGGHWSAWDAVGYSAQRWTSLSITTRDSKAAKRALRSIPAPPRLEELSVSIRGPCGVPMDERRLGFSPNEGGELDGSLAGSCLVRSLRLSVFTLPLLGPMFHQLTKLFIVDTFATLENTSTLHPILMVGVVEVLTSCTNLEEFSFEGEATALWLTLHDFTETLLSQARTILPRLRTIYLRCHEKSAALLLSCIATPNLESANLQTLGFRPETSNNPAFDKSTLDFLNSCPSLRTLRVRGFSGLAMLAASVVGLSHLESLHLDLSSDPDVFIKGMSQKDRFKYLDQPIWVARKLAFLSIDAEPHFLSYTNILHLLIARREDKSHEEGPVPLISLLVNGHDMGKEMNSQRFLEFVRREATHNYTQPPTRLQTLRDFFV